MDVKVLGVAVAMAAICSAGPAVAAADGDHALALAVADEVFRGCASGTANDKPPPFSIAVVDAGGHLIAFRRADGASVTTGDFAVLKARSSALTRSSTEALGAYAREDPATRDAFAMLAVTADTGGEPLVTRGGRLLGAVGVSGGSAAQDKACAARALAFVAAKAL